LKFSLYSDADIVCLKRWRLAECFHCQRHERMLWIIWDIWKEYEWELEMRKGKSIWKILEKFIHWKFYFLSSFTHNEIYRVREGLEEKERVSKCCQKCAKDMVKWYKRFNSNIPMRVFFSMCMNIDNDKQQKVWLTKFKIQRSLKNK
jgi:hypothetical protein